MQFLDVFQYISARTKMVQHISKHYHEPLYRNSVAMMLNSTLAGFFGLLFWIVAARTMSAKDIGLATAAISATALIVGLSKLGLDTGLVRYLPESKNKNGLYSTVIFATLVLSVIIAAIFLAGIELFSPALIFMREGWFLPIFLGYIAISSIYSIQNLALISLRRADLSLIQNLLLGTRIAILFFVASMGVFGIFSALGAAFLITFVFGAFVLRNCGLQLFDSFDTTALKNISKFSLGNYIAGLFTTAQTSIIPIMIVNILGAEKNAYFYVAYSVAGLLLVVPNAVSMSLFVEGAHNLPLKQNVIKSLKLMSLFLVPALAFIILFGDKLLLLFSKEYSAESVEMLQMLAFSSIFSAVIAIFISIKKVQKDVRMINYVSVLLSVLIIGPGYFSLLKYGLKGLGYVWLGANAAVCIAVVGVIALKEKWL